MGPHDGLAGAAHVLAQVVVEYCGQAAQTGAVAPIPTEPVE
ncbi:hypothetical protein [Streptomyces sp. NPDC096311]